MLVCGRNTSDLNNILYTFSAFKYIVILFLQSRSFTVRLRQTFIPVGSKDRSKLVKFSLKKKKYTSIAVY